MFAGAPDEPVSTDWDRACGFRDAHHTMTARRAEDSAAFRGTQVILRQLPYLDGPYTTPARRADDLAGFRTELDRWLAAHPTGTVLVPACAGVQVKPAPWERFRRSTPAASADSVPAPAHPAPAQGNAPTPTPPQRVIVSAKNVVRSLMHWDFRRRRAAAQRKGLAVNVDHLAVRDVALQVAAAYPGATVVLYEDLPYLWSQPADDAVAQHASHRHDAVGFDLPVDTDEKFQRIQAYASQIEVMDPIHHRLSQPGSLPHRERYWQLIPQGESS